MNTRRKSLAAVAAGICLTSFALAGCGGGGHSSASSVAKFCKDDAAAGNRFDFSAFDPTDPSSLAQLDQALPVLNKLAHEAPAAITADMRTTMNGLDKVANGQLAAVDMNAFTAAGGRLEAFETGTCGQHVAASDGAVSVTPDTTDSSGAVSSGAVSSGAVSSDSSLTPDPSYGSDSSQTDATASYGSDPSQTDDASYGLDPSVTPDTSYESDGTPLTNG